MSISAGKIIGEPTSRIEIQVSCKSLKNKDLMSKSDPCCVMFTLEGDTWIEAGRTENVSNNLNPQFQEMLRVDYFFERAQKLKFGVYDVDSKKPQLSEEASIGQMECTLGEIITGSPFTKPLLIKGDKKAGHATMTLTALEVSTKDTDSLVLVFAGTKLENKDLISKSDPFLELSRQMSNGEFQAVARTEVIKNNLNPKWRQIEIKASRLCGENYKAPVKIDLYDYEDNKKHELIGSFETSVEELLMGVSREIQWPVINLKKKASKKSYQNSGVISLTSCKVTRDKVEKGLGQPKPSTFVDFVFEGLQINFTVAIDFTASNGNSTSSSSLHHIEDRKPNAYMRVIQSVGEIIQDYDSDKMFPALGYGGKIPPNMEVSHAFPLNFNAANPFCAGISGVLEAYRSCVSKVQLYGPTNFAPIILHAAQFADAARKQPGAKNYFVLLLITDGVITDMTDTIRAIVYASALPFSIIIVGVGSADFKAMSVLDGDAGTLKDDRGNAAKRDIVQFVAFRDYEYGPPEALAQQVLAEVPGQINRYFEMNNISVRGGTAAGY